MLLLRLLPCVTVSLAVMLCNTILKRKKFHRGNIWMEFEIVFRTEFLIRSTALMSKLI